MKAGELERAVELAARQAKEAIKGAKGWLRKRMPRDQRYRETLDQAALSAIFDLDAARSAPSFDKPWRDVASLLVG